MDCPRVTLRSDSLHMGCVIEVDVVYCRGAFDLKSGIPRPPCASDKVTSSRSSSGSGSVCPNSVARSRSSITSRIGSTYSSNDFYCSHEVGKFGFIPLYKGDISCMGLTLCDFREDRF